MNKYSKYYRLVTLLDEFYSVADEYPMDSLTKDKLLDIVKKIGYYYDLGIEEQDILTEYAVYLFRDIDIFNNGYKSLTALGDKDEII